MKQFIGVAVPLMVIYVMFVVGLSLTWLDFVRLKRTKIAILLGSLGPFLILPLFAVALVVFLDLAPYIEAGILLISICPGGGLSNFYTYLARASTALSISMTGISSLLAIIMMPILMSALVFFELNDQVFAVPIPRLIGQLIVTLLLPIAAGMWLRSRFDGFVTDHENAFKISSILVVISLVIFVLISGPAATFEEWLQITLVCILFCLLAMSSGFLVSRFAGLSRSDRFTLMVEYAVQNNALAAVIAVSLLGHLQFATMAAIYFLVQFPIIMGVILLYRKPIAAAASG